MLAVNNVTKRYRRVLANDQISLEVPSGVTAILAGPNGAGKSTLLKCIMGLLRFEGTIHVDGHHNKSLAAKRLSGYVPEVPQMYPLLTVAEHLELVARLYSVADWEAKAERLLERFELADKRTKLGSELSKGMQQKVSICSALLPGPRLLLLDEPLIGLDPHAIRELKLTLAELRADGCSLLLSTHILDSIDDIWDVVLVMQNGRFIAEITPGLLAERGVDLETMFFTLTENSSAAGAEAP
ncbi:MAG: ABC transporter ATP-binding protein [Bacillota bacterium]|nr:ABC transporter ATP-binding protein [Bacillota bacterium]